MEKHESKEIPNYGKLAWFACLFFFPLGLFALKKHYDVSAANFFFFYDLSFA